MSERREYLGPLSPDDLAAKVVDSRVAAFTKAQSMADRFGKTLFLWNTFYGDTPVFPDDGRAPPKWFITERPPSDGVYDAIDPSPGSVPAVRLHA